MSAVISAREYCALRHGKIIISDVKPREPLIRIEWPLIRIERPLIRIRIERPLIQILRQHIRIEERG